MAHKRSNQLTVSGEWAKHLRPHYRRAFWKAERRAFRRYAALQASPERTECHLGRMPTKVQELIARFEADDWFQVRHKGGHRQYHHATKRGTVTVAGKPGVDVLPGTLNSILKQVGLKR